MRLTAAISHEGDWYVARCPEVEVTSQGCTVDEARANLALVDLPSLTPSSASQAPYTETSVLRDTVFTTRVLDEDLDVEDLEGIATVVQDDLHNTYQLRARG
ncbi:MAG TPA: hypothetical protein VIW46_04775 [Acidimicrobiia bacterium]